MTTIIPACPWCNTTRHVQPAGGLRVFYCRKCCREFDDGDDADGTAGGIGYGPPDRRMIREENQRERTQQQARKHDYGYRR